MALVPNIRPSRSTPSAERKWTTVDPCSSRGSALEEVVGPDVTAMDGVMASGVPEPPPHAAKKMAVTNAPPLKRTRQQVGRSPPDRKKPLRIDGSYSLASDEDPAKEAAGASFSRPASARSREAPEPRRRTPPPTGARSGAFALAVSPRPRVAPAARRHY